MAYDPTQDYAASYDALQRRLRSNFASQRGQQQQDIATRGVSTSGVSQIPLEATAREQGLAESDLAGQFALEQARTGIEDRRSAEAFERQRQLGAEGFGREDALRRRLGQQQLYGGLIAGGLGLAGGLAAGPAGAAATPAIGRYLSGKVRGDYGQNYVRPVQ
jgi:hypothetical protein